MQLNSTRHAILALIMSAALVTPLLAADAQTAQTEAALKQADQKLAQREKAVKRFCNFGSPNKTRQQSVHCNSNARARRKEVHRQRLQVQALLAQLEAGQPVDPAAVDRVLREAGVPTD